MNIFDISCMIFIYSFISDLFLASEAGATLRSRLHLVDLAGSERLKRSMTSPRTARSPRSQLREAESLPSLQRFLLHMKQKTSKIIFFYYYILFFLIFVVINYYCYYCGHCIIRKLRL